MFMLPFADFAENMASVLVPMVIFMIPIVAILTKHQQRMAELIHGNRQGAPNPEIDMLRHEVAELKSLVHQQTLVLDEIAQRRNELPSNTPPAMPAQSDTGNYQ